MVPIREATPACNTTVTDTTVRPTFIKRLTPPPAVETGVEYRWVTKSGSPDYWLWAQPIQPCVRPIGSYRFRNLCAATGGIPWVQGI